MYGLDETCAMCVALLCQSPYNSIEIPQQKVQSQQIQGRRTNAPNHNNPTAIQANNDPPQKHDPIVASRAEDILLKLGGEPQLTSNIQLHNEMGGPSPQADIRYSHFHNALYMHFARLVRPLWSAPILDYAIVTEPSQDFRVNDIKIKGTKFGDHEIAQIQTSLIALQDFFVKHERLCRLQTTSNEKSMVLTAN
jgi:hypothetical protein